VRACTFKRTAAAVFDGRFWLEVLPIALGTTPVALGLLEMWLSKRRDRRFTVEGRGVTKHCRTIEEVREFIAENGKDDGGPKVTLHDDNDTTGGMCRTGHFFVIPFATSETRACFWGQSGQCRFAHTTRATLSDFVGSKRPPPRD
jgi:hypothetical protein